jgi:hypothetical protein
MPIATALLMKTMIIQHEIFQNCYNTLQGHIKLICNSLDFPVPILYKTINNEKLIFQHVMTISCLYPPLPHIC